MKSATFMLKNWESSPTIALMALVGVYAAWGSTFLIVQKAIGRMPVMDFLAIRFTVAAMVMIALRPTCLRGMTLLGLWRAIGLGVVLGLGYITQTYGLRYASATVSGFITGMFVVFTPVMSWIILRQKINRNTLLAVALATVGLALLSLHGWSVGVGELLTLGCAIFYAVHIVGLGEWSSKYEPYGFSLLQIATVAVIALVTASPGGITMPPDAGIWGIVAITACGYRTRLGEPFTKGGVEHVLKNRFYEGKVVFHPGKSDEHVKDGKHEVPDEVKELWMRCREVRQQRSRQTEGRPRLPNRSYLFSKVALCDHCGGHYGGQPSHRKSGRVIRRLCHARPFCELKPHSLRVENLVTQFEEGVLPYITLNNDWKGTILNSMSKERCHF
jgi:drug/metabolite transporter (DMT)-like permease